MQAPKTRTSTTDATPDEALDALLGVVQHGSYTLVALSNEQRTMHFTSGKTALSWGQEYVAEVRVDGTQTLLALICGGVDGRPKALMDGWKNGKAADKVMTAVEGVLSGTVSAPAKPTASFVTNADGTTGPAPHAG
jgi:hypothetical protein